MAPKRRDRDSEGSRNSSRIEHLQSDNELFLQAFEKPTQIYRYIRTRNLISPVFLYRNLTYMRDRTVRRNKERQNFNVDSILAQKLAQKLDKSRMENVPGNFMTLMFLGFFDKSLSQDDAVMVETYLSKISHKKRKESINAQQERLGTSVVKINPDDAEYPCKIPVVSVPTDTNFQPADLLNKSYKLQLNITSSTNFSTAINSLDEPSSKRLKPMTNINYECELVIFDKQSRFVLPEGEYALTPQDRYNALPPKNYSPKKHAAWETISDKTINSIELKPNPFEEFENSPKLKCYLAWTNEKIADLVDRPKPITISTAQQQIEERSNKENQPDQNHNGIVAIQSNNNNNNQAMDTTTVGLLNSKTKVIYQFIYNNNSRQQTESCEDYRCPWCSLNCICLYALLKHLKLCHARFNFTYVPMPQGARIDVCINELYDGSYTGSPHDLVGPSILAFSRAGPMRRTTVTRILVCRPRRLKPNLSEFLEIDENELNSQRPYITGHNRLYHHTMTCLPVHPKELDIDSEGENDPAWLQRKTTMMLDEFTDVNEGEKELMKMWNLHIMRNGYVGDIQIPLACEMFVDMRGEELLSKNLYKNFVMHMCNLFDYGLITQELKFKTITKIQRLLHSFEVGRSTIFEARAVQRQYWRDHGAKKQQLQMIQLNFFCDESEKTTGGMKKKDLFLSPSKIMMAPAGNSSGSSTSKTTLKAQLPKIIDTNNKDGKLQKAVVVPLVKKIVSKTASENPSNGRRKASSSGGGGGGGGNQNKNATPEPKPASETSSSSAEPGNKRKFSHLRDSPPRRRSAGPALLPPNETNPTTSKTSSNTTGRLPAAVKNRRNSVAVIGSNSSSRKRLSLTLTKVDK